MHERVYSSVWRHVRKCSLMLRALALLAAVTKALKHSNRLCHCPYFQFHNLSLLTSMNVGDLAYWEGRYAKEFGEMLSFELFDWYCPFDLLYKDMLKTMIDNSKTHKILIVGVGRSNIIQCLYVHGFRDITAIDISQTLIMQMQKQYESYPGVEFMVMDARYMHKFADETFTVIFDKGCVDTLFCGTDYFESSTRAMKEIYRVLKHEGVFMTVTHAPAIGRVPYFRTAPWAIESYMVHASIGEGLTLFILTRTSNQIMLDKKIAGAEAAIRPKAKRVVSSMEQGAKGMSTTRSGSNTGSITVSASADLIADMLNESAEADS